MPARTSRRTGLGALSFTALFFGLVALLLLFSDKGQVSGDGRVRFDALTSLVDGGRLTADRYSLLQPIAAAPLYLAGAGVYAVTHAGLRRLDPERFAEERQAAAEKVLGRFGKLVALGISGLVFAVLRRFFGFGPAEAATGVLIVLFGSTLVPHVRDFYAEPLWTLFSLGALALLAVSSGVDWNAVPRSRKAALAAALALSVPLNPLLAPVLAVVTAIDAARAAGRRLSRFLFPAVALAGGLALALGENLLRRGAPLDFGYGGEGFTGSVLGGLAGELVAPARGLVFFIPAALLLPILACRPGLPSPGRTWFRLGSFFSLFLLLGYAKWDAWHGGLYWGPRFLLPVSLLAALALAVFLREAWARRSAPGLAAGALLFLLSFFVYKSGAAIGMRDLKACLLLDRSRETCFWEWQTLPFHPAASASDLQEMALHRSTAVEVGGVLLFGALLLIRPEATSPAR